jgi:hypothetical protein
VNFDKNKWNKMIDTSLEQRVYDMDTLDEESNYIEEILSKAADKWTDKERVMVANAYKYAAETGDTKMFDLILQGCMTENVEVELVEGTNEIAEYEYTVGIDQSKAWNILGMLDEVDDISSYNLLYRISLYSYTYYLIDMSSKWDVEFSYEVDDEGIKSVSFKYNFDDETIERLDFLNAKVTNSYFEKTFDSDYIRSLEESMAYCESQTDVDILSNLYNRNYYEATSIDPTKDDFSDYAKLEFTQFVNNLMNYGLEDDPMSEIQFFTNQAIKTDEDRCNKKGNYYGNEYLEILGDYTQIVADKMADYIFDNASLYKNEGVLGELCVEMYDNLLMCGFWNMLSESMTGSYFIGALGEDYMIGDMTFYVNKIEYDKENRDLNFYIEMQDKGGNTAYVKQIYDCDTHCPYEYKYAIVKGDETGWKEQTWKVSAQILESNNLKEVKDSNDNDKIIEKQTAYKKMTEDRIKAVYNTGIVFLSLWNTGASYAVKTVVDVANSSSKWLGDSGRMVGNTFSESIWKESKYIMPIVEEGYNFYNVERTYEKSVNNISSEELRESVGVSVYGKIGGYEYLVTGGIYNPYTLANLSEIQENGIAEVIGNNVNVEKLAEEIGYRKNDSNHKEFIENIKGYYDADEISAELNLLMFGAGSDTEYGERYDWDILSMPNFEELLQLIDGADETGTYVSCIRGDEIDED